MNYLADMMKQALPNMPRLNQRLQQPGFGQQQPQQPQFPQQPQQAQGFQQGGAFQPPMQQPQIPRQPVQNHQYNPPAWANNSGQPPQWGAFQPRLGGGMRGGFFDGDLGQPDQGWKPWGGWGG